MTNLCLMWHYLQRLYDLGARRVLVTGTGPLGCVPAELASQGSRNGECAPEPQRAANIFNPALVQMLRGLNQEIGSDVFIIANAFQMNMDFIDNPQQFGLPPFYALPLWLLNQFAAWSSAACITHLPILISNFGSQALLHPKWRAVDKGLTTGWDYVPASRTCVPTGACTHSGTRSTQPSARTGSSPNRSWPARPTTWARWTWAPSWPWTPRSDQLKSLV